MFLQLVLCAVFSLCPVLRAVRALCTHCRRSVPTHTTRALRARVARFASRGSLRSIGWILPIARLAKAVRVTDCEPPIAYRLLSIGQYVHFVACVFLCNCLACVICRCFVCVCVCVCVSVSVSVSVSVLSLIHI